MTSTAAATKKALTSLKVTASSLNPVKAVIRPAGTCRSVYLYSPTLSSEEMQTLGYALQTFRSNTSLSSILITCDSPEMRFRDEENFVIPRCVVDKHEGIGGDMSKGASAISPLLHWAERERQFPTVGVPVLSGVEHPISEEEMRNMGDAYSVLLEGIRGSTTKRAKIPTIYVHHGLTTDGGLIYNCASHVVCTSQASYRIDNPKRGLSLDPIGSSFLLPRISCDSRSTEVSYGYAKLLALSGIEIDNQDLLKMNLATHAVDAPDDGIDFQNMLEMQLKEIPSYYYQTFVPKTPQYHGETRPMPDLANAPYRNRVVANLLDDVSCGQSFQDDFIASVPDPEPGLVEGDVFDEQYHFGMDFQCDFLTYGSQIVSIFSKETTMPAIMARLHEAYTNKEVQDIPELKHFVSTTIKNIETRSPLALCAVNQLFEKAKQRNDSLESCMNRERIVYKNLYKMDDYATWVECFNKNEEVGKTQWKHADFNAVTEDEIEELFQER